jgi:MFS family permease
MRSERSSFGLLVSGPSGTEDMFALVVPLTALLSGVALLLIGGGLLGTLLAISGSQAGFGDQTLGFIMSAYFAGFLAGTYIAPPAIQRMGHIRAFAFFAALAACTVLAHPVFVDPWVWGLLRVGTGVALVGMYTVIESWLNATVDGAQRGRVFAIYMAVTLLALALGQQLLRLAPSDSYVLFSLVAVLFCLAMMPVAATRLGQPVMHAFRRIGPRRLFRIAPAAAGGALFSGLVIGTFWGLGPVYAGRMGLSTPQVATFMSIAILGGALLQWPIGRLSDSGDRRTTLTAICLAAAVIAAVAALLTQPTAAQLYAVFFVFGGLAFAVYPVAVAHLLDHVPAEDVLPACSTVLLLHGAGSAIGPALAGTAMEHLGPRALPGYMMTVNALLAAFIVYRIVKRSRMKSQVEAQFHPMLRTTPTAMEMLPEAEGADAGD